MVRPSHGLHTISTDPESRRGVYKFIIRPHTPQNQPITLRRPQITPLPFMPRIHMHSIIPRPINPRALCPPHIRNIINMTLLPTHPLASRTISLKPHTTGTNKPYNPAPPKQPYASTTPPSFHPSKSPPAPQPTPSIPWTAF